MTEHTKEPWKAVTDCPGKCCWHIEPVNVEFPRWFDRINLPEISESDARRIVACVNACAGIPTGMLIAAGQSAVIALRPIDEVIAERDELLAAAQSVIDRWDTPLWKDVPATAEYINKLREAVAKVTT